jgi:dTDP-4-dehydrorhamnose reductase
VNAHQKTSLERLESSPEYAFRANTHPAANLAIAARGADIPMVQISSDQVFRGNKGPYKALDDVQPLNMYGVSMLYAERAVEELYPVAWRGHQYPTGATVVRLPALYGRKIDSAPQYALDYKDAQVRQDLYVTPAFVGEAAFLIARNIVESPQTLATQYVHCSPPSEPISWYDLIRAGAPELHITGVSVNSMNPRSIRSVRIGEKGGLVPTKGWVLPQDYTKGFGEFMWEHERPGEFVNYW